MTFLRKVIRSLGRRREPPCPACREPGALPIVYGLPSPDLMRLARRGRVALGGCVVADNAPVWACPACGLRFGGRSASPAAAG